MSKTFGAKSTTDEVLEGVDLSGKRVLVTGVSAGLGSRDGAHARGARRAGRRRRARSRQSKDRNGGSACSGRARRRSRTDRTRSRFAEKRPRCGRCARRRWPQVRSRHRQRRRHGLPKELHRKTDSRRSSAPIIWAISSSSTGSFRCSSPGSRLVNLSSAGHRYADVDLNDPNFEHTPYSEFIAYGRSKTANILFSVEFDRRHKNAGIRATAVHPGGISTELARHLPPNGLQERLDQINAERPAGSPPFELKTIPQGTATTVWAGVVAKAEAVGGHYCEDCHVAEVVEGETLMLGGVRSYALDPEHAKALWAKSEDMVGETF